MNNDKPNVDDVFRWIEDYHQSKHDYADCKQDTETAVNLLEKDFVKIDFRDADEIVNWFVSEFQMKGPQKQSSDKDPSYYRGFVAIENDNIINLRVSRHYGTKESLQRAYGGGKHKPDIAYHIIVDKKTITYNNNTPITNDCILWNIEIIVDEWFLSAMKSDKDKRDIVFKLVYVLTFGEYTNKTNESVEHTHINNIRKIYKLNMTHIKRIDEMINSVSQTEQRSVSYSELVELEDMFNEQVKKRNIKFDNDEACSEALFDFIDQYINGNDNPQISI